MIPEHFLLRLCGNKGFFTSTNCFNKTLYAGKVVLLRNYGSNRSSLFTYISVRRFRVVEFPVSFQVGDIFESLLCAFVQSLMNCFE